MNKKWPKTFLGKFGEIRAKFLRTPKNLPAPTPMPFDPSVCYWIHGVPHFSIRARYFDCSFVLLACSLNVDLCSRFCSWWS